MLVQVTGFEPTRLSTLEPETSASAVPPHLLFCLFAQKHYNDTIKTGACQYYFSKIEVYLNVFFQKLLTKAKKIVIIFRQAKKRRSASMEKYSRGRRGAPAKGVGRVTGAKVQILSSPPKKTVALLGDCLFHFCRRIFEPERRRRR